MQMKSRTQQKNLFMVLTSTNGSAAEETEKLWWQGWQANSFPCCFPNQTSILIKPTKTNNDENNGQMHYCWLHFASYFAFKCTCCETNKKNDLTSQSWYLTGVFARSPSFHLRLCPFLSPSLSLQYRGSSGAAWHHGWPGWPRHHLQGNLETKPQRKIKRKEWHGETFHPKPSLRHTPEAVKNSFHWSLNGPLHLITGDCQRYLPRAVRGGLWDISLWRSLDL